MESSASQRPSLSVFAPGSVSNVACGFDTLGFAVSGDQSLGDLVTVTLLGSETHTTADRAVTASNRDAISITSITGDDGRLPLEPESNTAAVAAMAVLHTCHQKTGLRHSIAIEIEKRMPLCSGLGSSAASAVAGATAAYELLRREFDFELSEAELLECALAGELVASGGRHADNVAPSMLGGFVLVRCLDNEPDVVTLPDCSDWLWCAIARPEIAIDTLSSRRRMGNSVELQTAVKQWANLGALVAALYERDEDLLARALSDHVAEPARKSDVAGFDEAMAAAIDAGALGGSLSGSGPALFALATSEAGAQDAAGAMDRALRKAGHRTAGTLTSPVGTAGARVVSR